MTTAYQRTPHTHRIGWLCDTCSAPIDDGDGAVWIARSDILRAGDATEQPPVTIAETIAHLRSGPTWRVTHDACDGVDPEVDGIYDIAIGVITRALDEGRN